MVMYYADTSLEQLYSFDVLVNNKQKASTLEIQVKHLIKCSVGLLSGANELQKAYISCLCTVSELHCVVFQNCNQLSDC